MDKPTDEDVRYLHQQMKAAFATAVAKKDVTVASISSFACEVLEWVLSGEGRMVQVIREIKAIDEKQRKHEVN